MSKRLSMLITVISMLVVFSIAQAQQPTLSAEPGFVQIPEQGFIMSEGRVCNPRTMLC